jgi:hypothetical protein
VTQNLDAVLRNTSFFSHTTSPQPNPVQSQTFALIDSSHVFDTFVQQGLLSGGYVQIAANESYLKENSPTDFINPSVAPVVQVYIRQNLLNGFGTNVNSRFIQVAKKNIDTASETFRSQLLNVVALRSSIKTLNRRSIWAHLPKSKSFAPRRNCPHNASR